MKIKFKTFLLISIIFALIVISIIAYIIYDKANQLKEANASDEKVVVETQTQSVANTVEKTTAQATEEKDNIILYDGYEMQIKVGIQDLSDMPMTEENKKKYNVQYYNYENGEKLEMSQGNFETTYENYGEVENVEKIAMTTEYNAIPRKYEEINQLPEKLMDMADYSSVDIHAIDLNGDGKKEHIICTTINYQRGDIGDGEPEAFSEIMLFDSEFNQLASLAKLENGFWGNIKEEDNKKFIELDEVEYIDIDQDGIMEIIIDIPTYEGTKISVIKYDGSTVQGELNYAASVEP